MSEDKVTTITKKIVSELKCNCDDCLRHICELLGALIYESNFCELKHQVLLGDGNAIQEEEDTTQFDEILNEKCDNTCKKVEEELGFSIAPICLSKEDALKTPLDTKFLFDIISFKESYGRMAFQSHYFITIFIQKFAYAMMLAVTRLRQHNPVKQFYGHVKHLLVTITTALKNVLDSKEEQRLANIQNITRMLKIKKEEQDKEKEIEKKKKKEKEKGNESKEEYYEEV